MTISSIAFDLPTMRDRRWVPPVPGSTPRLISGRPTLPAPLLGDPQVRRHGDLEAAADGVAVEGRDHQLRRLLEAVEGLVGVEAEVVLEARLRLLQHLDVGAGAEELVALALEHQDVDVVVEARSEHGLVELTHHLVGVGVGGRVVEGDVGDAVARLVADQGLVRSDGFSHCVSSRKRILEVLGEYDRGVRRAGRGFNRGVTGPGAAPSGDCCTLAADGQGSAHRRLDPDGAGF